MEKYLFHFIFRIICSVTVISSSQIVLDNYDPFWDSQEFLYGFEEIGRIEQIPVLLKTLNNFHYCSILYVYTQNYTKMSITSIDHIINT